MKRIKRAHDLATMPLSLSLSTPRSEPAPPCPPSPLSVATPVPVSQMLLKQALSFKRKRSDSDGAFDMMSMCLDLEWTMQADSAAPVPDGLFDDDGPVTI